MSAMARRPKLQHVKWVVSKGRTYPYFNTGKKTAKGNPIYARLPDPSSPSFYQSYAAMKGARDRKKDPDYLVSNLVDSYFDSPGYRKKKPGTQRVYEITSRKIVKFFGKFPVNELRREQIEAILENEIAGAASQKLFLAALSTIYKYGRHIRKTDLEPTKDIDRPKGGEHEAWPEHVVHAGLESPCDRARLLTHLLYYTGQRIGDVCAMRWNAIDDGCISLTQQKTGKFLIIPIHASLVAELERTPKTGLTIVASEHGKPLKTYTARAAVKAIPKELGFDLVPHGLRKNAVISLLESGCTVAEVASITGQTFQMVERYAHRVNQKRLSKAAILKFENIESTSKRFGKP